MRESGGGLLFEAEDDLEDALARLASDRPLREKLGSAGRRAFLERWTESVVIEGYFAMIRRVAEEKRAAPARRGGGRTDSGGEPT